MNALIDNEPSRAVDRLENRVNRFDAGGLGAPPNPMQIFTRLSVLLGIALGFAVAAQWVVGAPVGAG